MQKEINKILDYKERLLRSYDRFDTPQYVLLEEELIKRASQIKKAFKNKHPNTEIYYSYKTNSWPYLCSLLYKKGIHAEVSSLFELKLALSLGVKKIIFNGPAKTKEEISLAIKNNDRVMIIVDSLRELNDICLATNQPLKLGIRLNLRELMDKRGIKFGLDLKALQKALILLRKHKNVSFCGFQFHLGSEIKNPQLYQRAFDILINKFNKLDRWYKENIEFIDIGGGIGVEGYCASTMFNYDLNSFIDYGLDTLSKKFNFERNYNIHTVSSIDSFSEKIYESFSKFISNTNLNHVQLKLEPGRWIVNSAVHLLSKVYDIKRGRIILDLGLNQAPHLRYEFHPIFNLTNFKMVKQKGNFFCSLLLSNNLLNKSYIGEKFRIGDVCCITNVGAYNNIFWQFSKPLPKVVSIDKTTYKIIRNEETFDYRFALDKFP